MDPSQPQNPVDNPTINNPLSTMQPGEQVLAEMKRSNIGLVGTYISAALAVIVMAAIVILVPHYMTGISSQLKSLLLIVFVFVLAVAAFFAYISTVIYKDNRWILTNDSLTQISQAGLFRKQTSQLSLANLEDVTAEQEGMLQSMFGFGTLRVETAGERSKFIFPYCANPNAVAQKILMARENFIRKEPEQAKRANDALEVPDFPANDPAANRGV
jgi:uncharacterized membrane protein YdbT with pleckstrin-like domain